MAFGFLSKLKEGLDKTRKGITDKIDDLFSNYGEIDDDLFDELEEILIMADVGMTTTMDLIERLRAALKERKIKDSSQVKDVLKDVIEEMLLENNAEPFAVNKTPTIIMVIGVNGVGKTTSIGKIAHRLKNEGKSVLIAAGDTFRAAAIDQLKIWGDRSGVPVIHQSEGSDPAAVIYDAVQSAKAKNVDVLICDTAGRLHNKVNLMNELAKVFRVIEREYGEAHKEVLLVLDATTGQNAIQQAKVFNEAAEISGIVLTKLDGTAKGGVVMAINSELQIPVKLIGVGEGMEDLQPFDAREFVSALFNL
ncbi:signal recognition particle-docking protein FtsY [Fusibacter sp. JL298sf-3]